MPSFSVIPSPLLEFRNTNLEQTTTPTTPTTPTTSATSTTPTTLSNETGFIILRHVNNAKTNEYWKECYRCIRKFYITNKILIIDFINI